MYRVLLGLVGLLAAIGATPILAQTPAEGRTDPSWTAAPDPDLGADLFPGFASFLGLDGWGTIQCRLTRDGHPWRCEIYDEGPHGLGFGSAARVVITSGQLRAARQDGEIVPASIRTTVHFSMPETVMFGGWTGPEPSARQTALATRLVALSGEDFPDSFRDRLMDGLDYDRRAVVRGWLDELLPFDAAQARQSLILQIARIYSEDQLKRMVAGEQIRPPDQRRFYQACPDPTPEQLAALDELRRRYCDRWDCGANPPG